MAFTGNIWLRHCQGVTVRWAQGDSCKYNSAWNISSNVYGKLIAKNLLDLWRVELSYRQCHIADPHLGKLKLSFFVSWKQNPIPPAPPRLPWSKFIFNCWQSPLPPNSSLKELTGSNARPQQDSTPGRNKRESLVVIIRSSSHRINETKYFGILEREPLTPNFNVRIYRYNFCHSVDGRKNRTRGKHKRGNPAPQISMLEYIDTISAWGGFDFKVPSPIHFL